MVNISLPKEMFGDPSFFLIGLPRSGTTLLQAVISTSENAWLSPECHWLPHLFDSETLFTDYFQNTRNAHGLGDVWKDGIRLFNRYLIRRNGNWGLQLIGRKNSAYLVDIAELYPKSKFVYLIRDPRDSLLSMIRTGIAVYPSEFPKVFSRVHSFAENQPTRFLTIKYEDVVLKPESTIARIADFIECTYDRDMLYPLTQRISGNQTPCLSRDMFKRGHISIDPGVVQRWKRELIDEDLLDLCFLFPVLSRCGYEVYEQKSLSLSTSTEGPFLGRLMGATLSGSDDNRVTKKKQKIDIYSTGALGLEILEGHESIKSIHLQNHGTLKRSEIFSNTYIGRLIPEEPSRPVKRPTMYTWSLFREEIGLKENSRTALYTAGGATRAFLKKQHIMNIPYQIECIIDQKARGTIEGIPITTIDEALTRPLDYIIVTSAPFYQEIREDLSQRGLKELDDFCLACFAGQEIV